MVVEEERSRKRILILLIMITIITTILVAKSTTAIGIGVNRAYINYVNVLKGGYAEAEVVVTTDANYPITGTYKFEGEFKDWLRTEPDNKTFTFSRDRPYRLKVIVEPPTDAANGIYKGGLRIQTGSIGGDKTKYGVATKAEFLVKLSLEVTGDQIIKCSVGDVKIEDSEVGELRTFKARVKNEGNVRLRPEVSIRFFDKYQTQELGEKLFQVDQTILPTTTATVSKQFSKELNAGQYWAVIEIPECNYRGRITFDVLDRGTIADKGEFIRIDVNGWAKVGDIIPIKAIFKNLGTRTVSAKFKGKITREDNGKIVKIIDSDLYTVPAGATANIETYFNPEEPGKYIVSGVILYNDKLTYERSAIITANGTGKPEAITINLWPFIIVIIIIILLLILIKKKKKERRAKRVIFQKNKFRW